MYFLKYPNLNVYQSLCEPIPASSCMPAFHFQTQTACIIPKNNQPHFPNKMVIKCVCNLHMLNAYTIIISLSLDFICHRWTFMASELLSVLSSQLTRIKYVCTWTKYNVLLTFLTRFNKSFLFYTEKRYMWCIISTY